MNTRRLLLLVVVAGTIGCGDSLSPVAARQNVVVTVTPRLAGAFASLGGTATFHAGVVDTLGNSLGTPVTWNVVPPSAGLSVTSDGIVTVTSAATAGDYRVRGTAGQVSDTVIVRVLPRPSGKLVFSAPGTVGTQIFVKDFSTDGDATQITSAPGTIAGISVDQSSGTLFFSQGTLPNVDIFRMTIDGASLTNLTNNAAASNQGPTMHPVTHDVYFTRRGLTGTATQVFRMRQDGSDLSQVTTGDQGKVSPAISPDGTSLAWTEFFQPGTNAEVVTAAISGDSPVRLTNRTGTDGNPYWISNSRVAWGFLTATQVDLFAVTLPGTETALNLTNGVGSSGGPSAGCSLNTITFIRTLSGETSAYQLDLTTGLVVKYVLPVSRPIGFARRLC